MQGAGRGGGTTTLGVGLAERDEALAFLDGAEAAAGGPLVDEWERSRLSRLTGGGPGTHVVGERHWSPLVAREEGSVVGYAGVVHPLADATRPRRSVGDVVVRQDDRVHGEALAALLDASAALAREHDAEVLEVWLRHAREEAVLEAAAAGFAVRRRLAVLGRPLDDPVPTSGPVPAGLTVRAWRDATDDAPLLRVLAAAYAGAPDGRWDAAALAERRAAPWFDPDDLLLAELDGEVVGLHWCKRRDALRGEVYNLAILPAAQGRGLGAALLEAGLARMAGIGCREVLLWVDLANERALRLYRGAGFSSRWEDVAFERTLVR